MEEYRNDKFSKEINKELEEIRAGRYIEKWSNIINSSNYDLAAHILNILQLVTIIFKQMEVLDSNFIFLWIQIEVFTNGAFLFELLSDIFIVGFVSNVLDKGRTRIEIVC